MPEKIVKVYELTQTVIQSKVINNKTFKRMTASSQWEWYKYMLHQILNKYKVEWYSVPEFHKAPNYNMHFHSVLIFDDDLKIMDYVDILKRCEDLGRCTFKKVSNYKSWKFYMMKDQHKIDNIHYKSNGFEEAEQGYLRFLASLIQISNEERSDLIKNAEGVSQGSRAPLQ